MTTETEGPVQAEEAQQGQPNGAYNPETYDPNSDPSMIEMGSRLRDFNPSFEGIPEEQLNRGVGTESAMYGPNPGNVVDRGEMTMQTTPITVYRVWHVPTAQERRIHMDLMHHVQSARMPDGSPMFSFEPIPKPAMVGKMVCKLHPDHELRYLWNQMGLPMCSKDDLDNDFQVQNHLERAHRSANKAIGTYEENLRTKSYEEERQADRRHQAEMLESFAGMQQATGAILSKLVDVITVLDGTGHVHEYEGKDTGAPCQYSGCDATRQ